MESAKLLQFVFLACAFLMLFGALVSVPRFPLWMAVPVALAAAFNPVLWSAVAAAFALKMASEGLLLHASCRHFDRLYLMRSLVPAQFLHVPYVVAIGFLGVFGSGFAWKGRELAR